MTMIIIIVIATIRRAGEGLDEQRRDCPHEEAEEEGDDDDDDKDHDDESDHERAECCGWIPA